MNLNAHLMKCFISLLDLKVIFKLNLEIKKRALFMLKYNWTT